MKNQTDGSSPTREVFILRLWRNTPQGRRIVEIQNVKTGEIAHLSGLDAIAGYLEQASGPSSTKSNETLPTQS